MLEVITKHITQILGGVCFFGVNTGVLHLTPLLPTHNKHLIIKRCKGCKTRLLTLEHIELTKAHHPLRIMRLLHIKVALQASFFFIFIYGVLDNILDSITVTGQAECSAYTHISHPR